MAGGGIGRRVSPAKQSRHRRKITKMHCDEGSSPSLPTRDSKLRCKTINMVLIVSCSQTGFPQFVIPNAHVAQSVEHLICNQDVVGSSPPVGSRVFSCEEETVIKFPEPYGFTLKRAGNLNPQIPQWFGGCGCEKLSSSRKFNHNPFCVDNTV